eukprot:918152_1
MAASFQTGNSIWACVVCTYENQNSSKLCEMCGSVKPSTNSTDDKGWKCILCTFANASKFNACGVCGAPSPLTNDLTGKQLCGACTTINYANTGQCIVCGQPLSNKIIQMNANGELVQMQMPTKPTTNTHSHVKSQSMPQQYANPLGQNNSTYNPFANGYQPQSYAPQPPQPPYQPSYQPPQQYQPYQQSTQPFPSFTFGIGRRQAYNRNKEVSQLFAKYQKELENDKQRIKKENDDVQILSEMYSHVYLTKKSQYDPQKLSNIMNQMMRFIPKEHWEEVEKNKEKYEAKNAPAVCQVCYCEFDQDEGKLIRMQQHCNHAMICQGCFQQHLKIKIKDDDITPWIPCAAPDCKAPVCCNLLMQHVQPDQLYEFAKGFIRKHLARNNNWIRCGTKNCNYGWMILDSNATKKHKLKCNACGKRQTVCKDPIQSDKGFNELIKSGVLRVCPKCSLPTMKDKGMCNVMHCGKCGIYWNWQTRETGTSSSQLKNKARRNGTLWEPGELAYQQTLQKSNLPEFKKLLERNGIKYDPNYVRGTR